MTPFDLRDASAPAARHRVPDLVTGLPRLDADPVPLGDVRAALGERPVWDGATLLWVDVPAGLVHRWPDGDPNRALPPWSAGSSIGLAWPTESGGVLVAATAGVRLMTPLAGEDTAPGLLGVTPPPGHRWNDGATDPAGRLWLTAMPEHDATAPGSIYRLTPDGHQVAFTDVTCGNGIQFSPDGRWMYVTDTIRRVIYRADYDPATGTPGHPEPWFALAADGPLPDGNTVDADGCLWAAVWDAGAVVRLDPSGEPLAALTLPTPLTTCLALGPDGVGWVSTAGDPDPRLGSAGASTGAGAVWRVRLPGVRSAPVVPVRGV